MYRVMLDFKIYFKINNYNGFQSFNESNIFFLDPEDFLKYLLKYTHIFVFKTHKI